MHDAEFNAKFAAKLNAYKAKCEADRAEILARLAKLEANPFGLQKREQPRAPLDAAAILNRLLVDPNVGDAVRQRVFNLRQEHIR
jgi:hypothetical protein